MRPAIKILLTLLTVFAALLALHAPLLRLPYFWDETGYYIPAALDFYRSGAVIPYSTPAIGHTPLVMTYLGGVWHLLGYSAWAARAAMTLIAAATVTALYLLGRRVSSSEAAAWSALLLAVSPLFFAQSTLAHLDLTAGLFTTLAVLFLLDNRVWQFALTASLAVLSKETAVILLPVAWVWFLRTWRRNGMARVAVITNIAGLIAPLLPLAAWALYYHHATGYWTGNATYLSYNLYSTLSPARTFLSLLRRLYELLIGGFNWLLTAGALAGIWWRRRGTRNSSIETRNLPPATNLEFRVSGFRFMVCGLIVIYLLFHSVVGGAVLPRYLLPIWPVFYLLTVGGVMRLPRPAARLILTAAGTCFVCAWFINPPYPFPFEDNLAYADFIQLHKQAAEFLQSQPGQARILTAWPATDELSQPDLGYVRKPLKVVAVSGFEPQEFTNLSAESFDVLYLYSRKWEPQGQWPARLRAWLNREARYFDYHPQEDAQELADRYHLHLVLSVQRRGQWVRIYLR